MEYPVPAFDHILGQPRVTQGPSAEATLRVIVFAVFALASMHYRIPYFRASRAFRWALGSRPLFGSLCFS